MDGLPPGGLSTSFSSLKANLFLSAAVAATGICLPIGLSFSLLRLVDATPLQAFAAGAALCSTSLGTTFTVLKTSALTKSRLGVVLTSAAMMDDVVGLIMVQIISNLNPGGHAISATRVVRPVLVSLAFAIIVPLCSRFLFLPSWRWLDANNALRLFKEVLLRRETPFVIHTSLLLAFVTGASYAGTSNLFAAYLAGALISWWDIETGSLVARRDPSPTLAAGTNSKDNVHENCAGTTQEDKGDGLQQDTACQVPSEGSLIRGPISEGPFRSRVPSVALQMPSKATQTTSETTVPLLHVRPGTGVAVYEHYYLVPVDKILKPLFFVRPS